MNGRRRRISFGTVAMLLIACITVTASIGLMITIRRDEGDLTMDAEKLMDSVTALMEMSQRHIGDETLHQNAEVSTTSAPSEQTMQQPAVPAENTHSAQATNAPAGQNISRHTVTMTFGGSVAIESSVLSGAYDKENNSYRYDEMLGGISSAVHADLNFVVLDTLLTSGTIHDKDLFAPSESVEALVKAGFDTALLCNENALSGGETVISETIQTLTTNGIIASGVYLPENSRRYDMLQVNGAQIAILSYTDSLSAVSKKAIPDTIKQASMVHALDLEQVRQDVVNVKAQGAHFILVFANWGDEEATAASDDQVKTAQMICDAGADMLIGYGSKHVQPVELLTSTSDAAHTMLTAWSLGTLLSEDRATRGVVSGALLHVQITCDEQNGSVHFEKVEYTPTYCWRQEEHGIYPYRVVRCDQSVPEGMIQKQREIFARALVLIQSTMKKGIAVQR